MIGNGNVAVDVARMLALTEEELAPTDTTDAAIAAILGCGIREILMLGRRGPAQAAFTTPELIELGELAGADVVVDPADLELDAASEAALERRHDRAAQHRGAARVRRARRRRASRGRSGCASASRRWRSSATSASRRSRSSATGSSPTTTAGSRAVPTDEREVIPCGIVFRSVGYRGVPLPGAPVRRAAAARSRTTAGGCSPRDGEPSAGVYCTGWIKRGPSGVIGTNKKDATETVELLLEDAAAGRLRRGEPPAADVDALLAERGVEVVSHDGLGGDRRRRARRAASRRAGRA